MAKSETIELEVAGHTVKVSNPSKVFFPEAGLTKLDLVQYYLTVADGALAGVRDRPMAMKRLALTVREVLKENGLEGFPK